MRKFIILSAAVLCFAGAAAAQNNTTATVAADPAPAPSNRLSSDSGYPWQVGTNFTYQRFDIGGGNTNLYGIHTTVTRWLGDSWFGLEGTVTASFGSLTPAVREKVVFYGGGAHVGKRSGRLQPWGHFLVGGAHDRFSQGGGLSAFNTFGIMGGGGVDLQWRSHIAWRFQADYLGTHFGGVWQQTVTTGVGILFDF
jgi:hypothetical protein